jgi:uncharacterized protein
LNFAVLDETFFIEAVVLPARARRIRAIGLLSGRVVVVVFSPLGSEALSVISMRRANRKDKLVSK